MAPTYAVSALFLKTLSLTITPQNGHKMRISQILHRCYFFGLYTTVLAVDFI